MQNSSGILRDIWCAIPVFNNKHTVKSVVAECLLIMSNVIVVDDGSTDADLTVLLSGMSVKVIRHDKNMGKGQAILSASRFIEEQGGEYMITIDGDGQHNPMDIKKFIPLLNDGSSAIIVGSRNFNTENVPAKSRFGRKFANFWLRVETGIHIDDCQSGFRAYPVKHLNRMKLNGSHYDFEAEVLAKAAWAGLELKSVDIDVFYPEADKRVSSFKPFLDNLRITHTHVMLILRRLMPIGHEKLIKREKVDFKVLLHPGKFLMMLLKEHSTPGGLAMSAAVGIFLAVLPLLFVHTLVILYVATRLNLNKIVAINVQHFCAPPFVPALCIELGYFMRNGQWLTDISLKTVFAQFPDRMLEWLLGSLIIAPAGAVLAGFITYFSAAFIKKRIADNA